MENANAPAPEFVVTPAAEEELLKITGQEKNQGKVVRLIFAGFG